MCGIVGVISDSGEAVVRDLANGCHFLQHRGAAYAGLLVFDPVRRKVRLEKGEGLADDIFKQLGGVRGDLGIAHTRYRTHGSGGIANAQPFYDPYAGIALAHNGHITNVPQIAQELDVSARTVNRELSKLMKLGLIEHFGEARARVYRRVKPR